MGFFLRAFGFLDKVAVKYQKQPPRAWGSVTAETCPGSCWDGKSCPVLVAAPANPPNSGIWVLSCCK